MVNEIWDYTYMFPETVVTTLVSEPDDDWNELDLDDEDYDEEDFDAEETQDEESSGEVEDSQEEELEGSLGAPASEDDFEDEEPDAGIVSFQWLELAPDMAAIEELRLGRMSTKGSRTVQEFDTVGQFVALVKSPDGIEKGARRLSRQKWSSWTTKQEQSKDETLDMMLMGWREGVENIKKFSDKVKRLIRGSIVLPELAYEVTGEMLDIARWVEGDPEDFMYMRESDKVESNKKPKVLRIVATIDIASYESAVMRGAAVIALTQMLEMTGTRVIIDAHCGSNRIVDTWVRVKEVNAPVNLESFVAVLCHPAVFYHMVMGAWEHLPGDVRAKANGLGTNSWGYISEPPVDERGDVYVSAIATAWTYSEAATLAWVRGELQRAGVELMEEVKA